MPYVNKVVYGSNTLIDLTADTVTPATLMLGYTAHDASGAAIVGTSTAGTMVIRDTQDSHGGTVREITAGSVVTGTKTITENGTYDVAEYADALVNVPSAEPTLQAKTATPTESQQTVTPDTGYDGLSSVTVGAISSTYVGSGITRRSSTDLTASGATVTVPSGYYSAQASKAVSSGTAGTPTATKGTVSNHSVSVTPSVTNTTGYITGGTKSGTAVTVAASELVSGTLSITSSGTKDVTNYASASVAAGSATASATKGSVSNHSVAVTPTVTRTAGYVTAGSANGTAVTVSASELVSGTLEVTESGTYDVTNYASADVSVSGGATNFVQGTFTTSSTTGSAQTIDIPYTGTGYPIIAHVEVTGGVANRSNTEWYNAIRRFSVGLWHMSKNDPNTGFKNYDTGVITTRMKTNATDGTLYSFYNNASTYYSQPNGAGGSNDYEVVTFTSKTQLSVFVSDSGTRGLMPSISYSYYIVYSE